MSDISSSNLSAFYPTRKLYRFTVLFFVSLLPFGSYFAYDSIGALAPILLDKMGITHTQIGLLYSFYSWPNVVFVFFAGVLLDKIGTRKASVIFSSMIVLGAAIVAAAPTFPVMLVGRIIFGLGSEALIVSQSAIIARWFTGKELALAFGIALTLCRLGTMFSFNTEATIADRFGGVRPALWAAVIFCIISFLCNLVYIIMDRRAERSIDLREEGVEEKIVLSDVKKLRPSFWFVTILCVTFYSAIFPFTAFSTDLFHEKWNLPLSVESIKGGVFAQVFYFIKTMFTTAGGTTSIIIFASMCFAPFAGALVDKIGRRGTLMIIGSIMMIPCYLLIGFTTIYPAIPMVILGAAFVLVPAAMWPSIPLIVEEKRVGTAFGLMTAIQNFGLATFPILNGGLREVTHTYKASMVMFAFLGVVGLIFAIMLKQADAKAGYKLERVQLKE